MIIDQIVSNSRASIEKEDLRALLHLLEARPAQHALEIGTWRGGSAKVWKDFFALEDLVTIDIIEDPLLARENGITYLVGDSQDPKVFSQVSLSKYNFLFIDGDHNYESVKADFELYSPLVKPSGVIVLHDVCHLADTVTVKPLWEELKTSYKSWAELKTTPGSTGVGVLFL